MSHIIQGCKVTAAGRIRYFPQQAGHDVVGSTLEGHHVATAVSFIIW
jgi:hypothetical protein